MSSPQLRVVALAVALVSIATPAQADPRAYAGPLATAAPSAEAPAMPAESPAPAVLRTESPPPPRAQADSLPPPRRPPLVIAGVATISLAAAGYVAMIAGLGLGANADANVAPLGAREDIGRRRELVDRGQLGNRLAIGAGVAAAVAMATGIALVVVGRRRAHMNPGRQRRR